MKQKEKFLIIDVEGAGTIANALTYDVGGAVIDREGKIYETFSFVVREIFFEKEIMNTAYYGWKLPTKYLPFLNNEKRFSVKNFNNTKFFIRDLITKYSIKKVFAYNARYDRNALNNTSRFITPDYKWFFPYGMEFCCIWNMACQVICTQKKYKKFIDKHGLRSEKGNMRTSAEIVYAYMTNNVDFTEEHTGFEDVQIEIQILVKCFRQHKKMTTNLNGFCWRIPQSA